MYKGDLKRLVLGFAGRIQATFTMSDAFDEIKDADSKAEVSNAISELYRDGKLARQKTKLGNSYLYALPAFAPAAFEMNEEPLSEQIKMAKSPKTYIYEKIDEIRTAADQEEAKPAESPKATELVSETEQPAKIPEPDYIKVADNFLNSLGEDAGIAKEIDQIMEESERRDSYYKSLLGVANPTEISGDSPEVIRLSNKFKVKMKAPNGLSITIESAG